MNEIFKYETKQVRTQIINDNVWFCLKDVCDVLELSNTTVVSQRLDEDEVTKLDLGSQVGLTNFVNESGLYAVILRSDKPEAKKFRKWVTSEVLPSIRKNGAYMLDSYLEKVQLLEQRIEKLEKLMYTPKNKQLLIVGDHVTEFLKNYDINNIVGVPTYNVYNDYLIYCNSKNIVAVSKTKFTQTLGRLANLHSTTTRLNGKTIRIYK